MRAVFQENFRHKLLAIHPAFVMSYSKREARKHVINLCLVALARSLTVNIHVHILSCYISILGYIVSVAIIAHYTLSLQMFHSTHRTFR